MLGLEWLLEKYVAFRHLVRFFWGYIRYVIMLNMSKRSGIQSSFCDFRHATTSMLGDHSRFSHMQRPVLCLPQNYSLVHEPRNLPNNSESKLSLNKLRPFSEHVITKLSTVRWEFRLLNSVQ